MLSISHTVKPNHRLEYNIGINFCIENAMNSNFHSVITCNLTQRPVPQPIFLWTVTLNGTDATTGIRTYNDSNVYPNDVLILMGEL